MRKSILLTMGVLCVASVGGLFGGHEEHSPAVLVDSSRVNGEVTLLRPDKDRWAAETMLRGVKDFYYNSKGPFVFRNKDGEWYVGKMGQKDSVKPLDGRLVPQDVESVAVSNGGDRIVWATRAEEEGRAGLVLSDVRADEMRLAVSIKGWILEPEWAPDDSCVAYYYGPQEAILAGIYSLGMVRFRGDKVEKEELAGPSFCIGYIGRSPPQWSPDGKRILFEGRYTSPRGPELNCIVDVRTKELKASPPGWWSVDGKGLFTVRHLDGSRVSPAVANPDKAEDQVEVSSIVLPRNRLGGAWSSDGSKYVYVDDALDVYLIHVRGGEREKLWTVRGYGAESAHRSPIDWGTLDWVEIPVADE